jgi:hypothetical protein
MNPLRMSLAALLSVACVATAAAGEKRDQATVVSSALAAIAGQISDRPAVILDFTEVSGAYCFNVDFGKGGHMTHYAVDPAGTQEDVIDFVNAGTLAEAGLSLERVPQFPGKLGAMEPNRWYYLPAGQFDPHHGQKFPFPVLMRASKVR